MKITRTSQFSGKENTLDLNITPEAYNAWLTAGPDSPVRFVQDAFPHLTDDEREFLITGVTATEWQEMFG